MIGNVIKDLRKEKKLSLRALAQSAGISKSTLSDLENENNNTSINTLDKIATALGVPINRLLTDKEKVSMAVGSLNTISDMASRALAYNSSEIVDIDRKENGPNPLSSLFENEIFSEEEQTEISNFVKYLLSKRK
jgi:transcriptional regulator with XRE-family HTH domain